MIVVDTNVIAYLLIRGEMTGSAQDVFRKDPHWMAPLLWQHEFLNVLATYARDGGATEQQAEEVWHRAMQLLEGAERSPRMTLALQLAVHHAISAYDAQYVALAQERSIPLVTEDRRVLKAFPSVAVSMAMFLAT